MKLLRLHTIAALILIFVGIQSFALAHSIEHGGEHHHHDGITCEIEIQAVEPDDFQPDDLAFDDFEPDISFETTTLKAEANFVTTYSGAFSLSVIVSPPGRAPPARSPPVLSV